MINWKVRFKNPQFVFQFLISIAVPIFAYYGIEGTSITSWSILFNLFYDAISNPYVVFTIIVSVYNAINDPTTHGLSDSEQALDYKKPKK